MILEEKAPLYSEFPGDNSDKRKCMGLDYLHISLNMLKAGRLKLPASLTTSQSCMREWWLISGILDFRNQMKDSCQFQVRGDTPHQLLERTSGDKAQCRSGALVE